MLIEYWFDFSCPYAYLGSELIEALAARCGAELRWKPMLLGGVFRAIGNHEAGDAPGKRRHNYLDMHRWADVRGIPFTMPAGHPMRTVAALRALLSLPEDRWPAVIHGFYRAYWRRGLPPSEPSTIRTVLAQAGCDEAAIERALAADEDAAIKDQLRARTDEAVARGVFGAPTLFVSGGDLAEPLMFWGQDRLHMVEAVLGGWRPGENVPPRSPRAEPARSDGAVVGPATTVHFWFDFSSPFSYLGATQIEAICARHGATLRWRPMLLGALFKEVGAPNVPLLAMSESKRRYVGRENGYWASWWQVPFTFTSHFPLRTVLPLRLVLAAGEQPAPLIHALYRAAWVDNVDIGAEPGCAQ
ncbi:MAG TPA: DsbA family protein, partial [Kofleriaceae bacterium]|nr:DsbA family protein [Kofleriaceae bacterium]